MNCPNCQVDFENGQCEHVDVTWSDDINIILIISIECDNCNACYQKHIELTFDELEENLNFVDN